VNFGLGANLHLKRNLGKVNSNFLVNARKSVNALNLKRFMARLPFVLENVYLFSFRMRKNLNRKNRRLFI
jgi:hypothetical protein